MGEHLKGIPVQSQQLMFGNHVLRDDLSLQDQSVGPESTLDLVLALSGSIGVFLSTESPGKEILEGKQVPTPSQVKDLISTIQKTKNIGSTPFTLITEEILNEQQRKKLISFIDTKAEKLVGLLDSSSGFKVIARRVQQNPKSCIPFHL